MGAPWYHRKQHKDTNHYTIVHTLKYHGVMVADLSQAGSGVPDLLCGYRGVLFCVEVKTATGTLSPLQRQWFDEWHEYPALVLRTPEDVVHVMGVLRDAYDLADVDWASLVPRGRRRARQVGADTRTRRPSRRRRGDDRLGAGDE